MGEALGKCFGEVLGSRGGGKQVRDGYEMGAGGTGAMTEGLWCNTPKVARSMC